MDTSTTLKEQIQALMDSLADTALSAAESRHQSQAGEAHLLYALYRNDGLVGSMLRGHGLESSEIRLLMSDIPNRPLKTGEDPVLSTSSRRILHDAHDAAEDVRRWVMLLETENGITDEELGEWVERKTVRQQRRIEGDK